MFKPNSFSLKLKKFLLSYRPELFIVSLSLITGGCMAFYIFKLDLIKSLTDENAHLNFSRLIWDSMTPGISQIGFWPPLIHILLMPFTLVPSLYNTGIAGAFTLIPIMAMGSFFIYKLTKLMTENSILSVTAALLYIFNPYVLYYASTPMMEVLFISNLFGVAYFLAKWLKEERLSALIFLGGFVTLTCLSRYEGLFLIPIVTIILLINQIKNRDSRDKIEATMLLYLMVAVIGITFILTYSLVFGKSLTAFTLADSQVRQYIENTYYTKHNIFQSVRYFLYASYYMLTKFMVFASLFSFVGVLFASKKKFFDLSILLTLMTAFFVVVAAMYRGSNSISVSDLPPLYTFHNDRYGLTWIGFSILSPLLFTHYLIVMIKFKRHFFSIGISLVVATVLLSITMQNFYTVAFVEKYKNIKLNLNSPRPEDLDIAYYIRNHYDFGKVLLTRSDNDPVLSYAKLNLSSYIYEGNYRYFDQTMKEPWMFARWVIMDNSKYTRDNLVNQKEAISDKWDKSEVFHRFYTLVYENPRRKIYRVNLNEITKLAAQQGYNVTAIPSINKSILTWETRNIYFKIQATEPTQYVKNEKPLSKDVIKNKLIEYYKNHLRTDYKSGFRLDEKNMSNSESQSYALLQSYLAEDQETFANVWHWTKKNLQRNKDHLFAWQFKYDSTHKTTTILDNNPATDADTDIAYALLRAGVEWSNSEYISEAQKIIPDIWNIETVQLSSRRYVIAGNWANKDDKIVINPSYFSPAQYRLFALYDKENDWDLLISNEYTTLLQTSDGKLKNSSIFLPVDWAEVNKKTEVISKYSESDHSLDYSYDAFRVMWRLALDNQTDPFKDNNAANDYLKKVTVFKDQWSNNHQLCTVYKFTNGTSCELSNSTLAGPLGVFTNTKPDYAEQVIQKYYVENGNLLITNTASFYEKSWYWFSLMLWTGI